MHRCPNCDNKLTFGFVLRIQKWAPTRGCPSCGKLLTHSGMLASGAFGGALGGFSYQVLKLYVTPVMALLVTLLICFFFGYREYRALKIIPADDSFDRKIKSSIELSPTATRVTAYLGILGSFLLLAVCIFIVAILSIDGAAPPAATVLFCALALIGLGGLIVSVRTLRGKSLLSGYPLRKQ